MTEKATVTKTHRLLVAQAWEGVGSLSNFVRDWVDSKPETRRNAGVLDRLAQALADAELRGAASKAGEWVACSDRLPEPGQWVLAHRPGHHMRMFQHTGWGWRKEDGTIPSHTLEYTHWQPLPQPPTPEQKP